MDSHSFENLSCLLPFALTKKSYLALEITFYFETAPSINSFLYFIKTNLGIWNLTSL